jgi:hypothetical protein
MIIEQKYIDRFHKNYIIDPITNCWNYNKSLDKDGYGSMSLGYDSIKKRYTSIKSHRFSIMLDGRDPTGLLVCHHCDNPRCVNPQHLFLGTAKDNHQDRIKKGRSGNSTPSKGSKNGNSRISEDVAKKILNEYQTENVSQVSLSKKYNVSTFTVWTIVNRKNWQHI